MGGEKEGIGSLFLVSLRTIIEQSLKKLSESYSIKK